MNFFDLSRFISLIQRLSSFIISYYYFGKPANVMGSFRLVGIRSLLTIGTNVTINHGVSFTVRNSIFIGDNVILSEYVSLYDCGLDPSSILLGAKPFYTSGPIILGNNVWIGARSVVLPGVSVGANSIIGAGSVVTKDIPPRCVACGNPAKIVSFVDETTLAIRHN